MHIILLLASIIKDFSSLHKILGLTEKENIHLIEHKIKPCMFLNIYGQNEELYFYFPFVVIMNTINCLIKHIQTNDTLYKEKIILIHILFCKTELIMPIF